MTRFPIALTAALCVALPALAQAPFASFERASKPILSDPHDLAIGPGGRLYVADKFAGRIAILDAETLAYLGDFGDGRLAGVRDISFAADRRAYVAATALNAVVVFRFADGAFAPEAVLTGFPNTEGVLAHSGGRLYVMASGSGRLHAIENGEIVATAGGMPGAHDVAEAPDGSVWVADNFNRRLVRFSAGTLEVQQVLDDPAYGFRGPRYLDFDDFGRLVVADQDAHRILLIDPLSGALLGVLGDGAPGLGPDRFDNPEGVAAHGSTYYISDSDNDRIVKYVVVVN